MKINKSMYESYFSFKPSEDDESVEKVPDAKWYNLAMKNKTEETREFLEKFSILKESNAVIYMNRFFEVIENHMDYPIELLLAKSKCNFYDISLDAICEVMDNKKSSYLLQHEEFSEMYQKTNGFSETSDELDPALMQFVREEDRPNVLKKTK